MPTAYVPGSQSHTYHFSSYAIRGCSHTTSSRCKKEQEVLPSNKPKYAAAAKLLQSCPTLCDPIDGSPPGSPVPGILQARTRSGWPFPSPKRESEK